MKKRAMKKYIPRETMYCDGCKNYIYFKIVNDYMVYPKNGNKETIKISCKYIAHKCRYTNVSDERDALLYDQCKVCNVGIPNY